LLSSSSSPVLMISPTQSHPVNPLLQLGPKHLSQTLSQMGPAAMKGAAINVGGRSLSVSQNIRASVKKREYQYLTKGNGF
jgi:hypothetical protein